MSQNRREFLLSGSATALLGMVGAPVIDTGVQAAVSSSYRSTSFEPLLMHQLDWLGNFCVPEGMTIDQFRLTCTNRDCYADPTVVGKDSIVEIRRHGWRSVWAVRLKEWCRRNDIDRILYHHQLDHGGAEDGIWYMNSALTFAPSLRAHLLGVKVRGSYVQAHYCVDRINSSGEEQHLGSWRNWYPATIENWAPRTTILAVGEPVEVK